MKKPIFLRKIIMIFAMIMLLSLSLCACGNNEEKSESDSHKHKYSYVEKDNATHEYKCSICGDVKETGYHADEWDEDGKCKKCGYRPVNPGDVAAPGEEQNPSEGGAESDVVSDTTASEDDTNEQGQNRPGTVPSEVVCDHDWESPGYNPQEMVDYIEAKYHGHTCQCCPILKISDFTETCTRCGETRTVQMSILESSSITEYETHERGLDSRMEDINYSWTLIYTYPDGTSSDLGAPPFCTWSAQHLVGPIDPSGLTQSEIEAFYTCDCKKGAR